MTRSGKPTAAKPPRGRRLAAMLLSAGLLGGCQSTREEQLAEGYPLAFADGFQAGCASGRATVSGLGRFQKDALRYLQTPLYAEGWHDGYQQCQESASYQWERQRDLTSRDRERDRQWRHSADQHVAQALRRRD